jgi:dGTPase
MNVRERWEDVEKTILAPWASKSVDSKGRDRQEAPCPLRTCYQRDRDRIVHSKAFRRLKHKTQVLLLPEGDHFRTRLTHTLEVSQIARTLSRALGLNEDLTEAIALGHDLGHTPFGHTGERVLDRLAKEHGVQEGFHHAPQSLRVVVHLENDGKGLNLTQEVLDGILRHSKGQVSLRDKLWSDMPITYEGCVVRLADSIAYLNHDLDDALRAELLHPEDIPPFVFRDLGATHGQRIGSIVEDVVACSGEGGVAMSDSMLDLVEELRSFLYCRVYADERAKREEPRVEHVLRTLFTMLLEEKSEKKTMEERQGVVSLLDFLSGMSDRYALFLFEKIAVPSPWPLEKGRQTNNRGS